MPQTSYAAFNYVCTEPASGLVHLMWLLQVLLGACFVLLKSRCWDFGGRLKFLHTILVPTDVTPILILCLHTTVTLLQVYLGAMGDAHIYASLPIQLNSVVSGDLLFDQLQENLFIMTQSMVRAIKCLPQKLWKNLRSRQTAEESDGGGRGMVCIARCVLGSSCLPVQLTRPGPDLLQKL